MLFVLSVEMLFVLSVYEGTDAGARRADARLANRCAACGCKAWLAGVSVTCGCKRIHQMQVEVRWLGHGVGCSYVDVGRDDGCWVSSRPELWPA